MSGERFAWLGDRDLHELDGADWSRLVALQLEHHGLGSATDPRVRQAASHVAQSVLDALRTQREASRPSRPPARHACVEPALCPVCTPGSIRAR